LGKTWSGFSLQTRKFLKEKSFLRFQRMMTKHIVIGRIGILLKCRRETLARCGSTPSKTTEKMVTSPSTSVGQRCQPAPVLGEAARELRCPLPFPPIREVRPNLEVLQLCVRRSWNTIYPVGVAKPKGAFVGCVMCGEMGDSGEGKISSKPTVFSVRGS
jgi:hypothetical protein